MSSPGIRILEAVNNLVPELTPSSLTILSICIVEDLSLDFPDVKINFGRALFKTKTLLQEILVPQINDLSIINSPLIIRLKNQRYSKISNDLISNYRLFESQRTKNWYCDLIKEIHDALSDYMSSIPLIDNTIYRSNFSFAIQPGDKRKINTNYRWPKFFNTPMTVSLYSSNYILKKKTITALFEIESDSQASMERVGNLFPQPGFSTPMLGNKTTKADNSKIIQWVNDHLSIDLIDHCYGGIFSPLDIYSTIKFTIINNSEDIITINEGDKLVELKIKFE